MGLAVAGADGVARAGVRACAGEVEVGRRTPGAEAEPVSPASQDHQDVVKIGPPSFCEGPAPLWRGTVAEPARRVNEFGLGPSRLAVISRGRQVPARDVFRSDVETYVRPGGLDATIKP
jgi:hypothetical protein